MLRVLAAPRMGCGREASAASGPSNRLTVSSGAPLSARRRRGRRTAEMLLVVRRAERDTDLLQGGPGVGSRS
jgi:hypothetical protein